MTVFNVHSIEELPRQIDDIVETVEKTGYAIIRGLFNPKEIRHSLDLALADLAQQPLLPSSGILPEQIKDNVIKWSIGGESLVQQGIARMMLTIYNTFFSEDRYTFHSHFKTLIQVRDVLARRENLFDEALLPERYNGCRLQVYPAGGGFMGPHIDKRAIDNNHGKSDFIQTLMLVTQKGVDYTAGGAYVVQNDEIIDVEAGSQSGDVVIYNSDSLHGVADIDPHLPLDRSEITGRVVALVTIYANSLKPY